jgi:hypothetical protein
MSETPEGQGYPLVMYKKQLSLPLCLAREMNLKRKLFPNHLPSILHGVLVGAGSLCPCIVDNQQVLVPVLFLFYLLM